MNLAPITVQLSNFQQIEILRDQIEQFEEELKKTEVKIREVMYEDEKQRYLRSVHSIFHHSPPPAGTQELPELNRMREALANALEALKAALQNLEATSGPVPPRPPQPQRPPIRSGLNPQVGPSTANPNVASPLRQQTANPNVANPLKRNRFDTF